MSIMNCVMSYDDIICLIDNGFKPMRDLKLALDHNLLERRRKCILMYLKPDDRIIDIMGYYVRDPFPRILINPLSSTQDIVTVNSIPEIKEILVNGG